MATTPSRLKDGSILGESWVLPSSSSDEEPQKNRVEPATPSPSPRRPREEEEGKDKQPESIDAVVSSMSGPELIMPSICETPELATHVQSSSQLKRRHRESPKEGDTATHTNPGNEQTNTTKDKSAGGGGGGGGGKVEPSSSPWERPLRTVINISLIAALIHLLVLPELVYLNRHLCTIPVIPTLYAPSCTRHHVLRSPGIRPHPYPSNPYDSVLSLQTQLEHLFNSTLDEIAPYAERLPETETLLQDLHDALKKAQVDGPQHELTLEFDGCRHALATATRKLDSLKADLQAAVDSLLATAGLPTPSSSFSAPDTSGGGGGSGGVRQRSSSDIAKDARLSTQMARREKYLDQLAARMRVRTDSLTGDFATLADHLESLRGIVARRVEGSQGENDDDSTIYKNIRTFVDSIVPGWRGW